MGEGLRGPVSYAGKNFGGFKVMAGLVAGRGVSPPDAGKSWKICKKTLKKMEKYELF